MNPLFQSNRTTPNRGTAPGESINESNKKYSQGYNKFDYSRPHYFTARYGDITPFEVVEGVGDDKLEFGCKQSTRSTSAFSSALESTIYEKNCYYMVDMQAILPLNWKKIYMNPNKGDDVTSDVNTFGNPFQAVLNFLSRIQESLSNGEFTTASDFSDLLRLVFLLESLYSKGSVLKYLGFSSFLVFDVDSPYSRLSFDKALDVLFGSLSAKISDVVLSNPLKIALNGVKSSGQIEFMELENLVVSDFSQFVDVFREYYSTALFTSDIADDNALEQLIEIIGTFFSSIVTA